MEFSIEFCAAYVIKISRYWMVDSRFACQLYLPMGLPRWLLPTESSDESNNFIEKLNICYPHFLGSNYNFRLHQTSIHHIYKLEKKILLFWKNNFQYTTTTHGSKCCVANNIYFYV